MTVNIQTPQKSGYVIDVDERTFRQEVLDRSRDVPVVVDFWAPWCGPCRTLGPTLEKLAAEGKGSFILAKLNVDNNQRLAQMFQVQGIPAVKAFRDGRIVDEFTGALPESQVRAWLKGIAAPALSVADGIAEQGAALEEQNPNAAIARYREALVQEPQHGVSLLGLGRMLLLAGDPEGSELLKKIAVGTPQYAEAQGWIALGAFTTESDEADLFELLERTERDPADLEARYLLAAHQVRGRKYAEAIGNLLAVVERNRELRDDGARKALVAIFAVLGEKHPLAIEGRRKLANALF
jgi:putative thioredoxin